MTIERKEVGARMSQIVVHGDTVYLAGIVARANKGKSVTEQTKEIVDTIDSYLAQAGTNKTKLLSANIWITDMAKFAEMNAVWDAWVAPGQTPARACVEAKLAAPGLSRRDHGGGGEVALFPVITGLVPVISLGLAVRSERDGRVKPGHDEEEAGGQSHGIRFRPARCRRTSRRRRSDGSRRGNIISPSATTIRMDWPSRT